MQIGCCPKFALFIFSSLLGLLASTLGTDHYNAQARLWHIRADSPPPWDGSDSLPFPQIQYGAELAVAGDTVLVYAGTYYETVKPVRSGEETGGVIKYVYYVSAGDGPAIVKAQQNFCFVIGELYSIGGAHYVDYIWIEGFYLTNGYGTSTAHGSAIRTFSNYGVFVHNKIYDNDVGVFCEGNGIYAESGNNRGNYIAHNVISSSGESAVRLKHSSENLVVFNLMYHNGYRIELAAAVTFYCGVGNRVINNTLWDNGGGAVQAYNGTFSDSCIGSASSDVRDNIFARPDPGLLLNVQQKTAADTTSVFAYNLFWTPDSSQPVVSWGTDELNQGGYQFTFSQFVNFADTSDTVNSMTAQGCLFADPLFADAADLDFDLLLTSPGLNAGSRLAWLAPFHEPPDTLSPPDSVWADSLTGLSSQAYDIDGVDMGYHHLPLMYSVNPPLAAPSNHIYLYPNPYSGSGGMQFLLPNMPYPRRLSGKIYNILGQKVAEFRIPDNPLNLLHITWAAQDMANGKYFLELNINGRIYLEPLVLRK